MTCVPTSMEVPAFAKALDKDHGILTRAGLHCAPEVHRLLGSDGTGAVRLSLGWCTTEADIDRAIDAVAQVAGAGKVFSSQKDKAVKSPEIIATPMAIKTPPAPT